MSEKKTDYKPQMSEMQEENIQALVDANAGVSRLHPDEVTDPLFIDHLNDSTTWRLARHGFFGDRTNTTNPTWQSYDDIFGGNSPAVGPEDPAGVSKMVIDKLSQPYSHEYSPAVEEQKILASEAKLAEERRLADMQAEFSRLGTAADERRKADLEAEFTRLVETSPYTPNPQASHVMREKWTPNFLREKYEEAAAKVGKSDGQSLREKYEDSRSAKRLADWWRQTHSLPALTETEMKTPYQPMPTDAPSAAAKVGKPASRKDVMEYYGIL